MQRRMIALCWIVMANTLRSWDSSDRNESSPAKNHYGKCESDPGAQISRNDAPYGEVLIWGLIGERGPEGRERN
jgi:hypothetical protein